MVGRISLVLLACGSFNPITNQHMRLFELARDHMHQTGRFRVVSGIVSPVSDGYGKRGLAVAHHRVAMAKLALRNSDWVTVDDWESQQPDWTETIVSLRHHHGQLSRHSKTMPLIGTQPSHSAAPPESPQLKLLCGADFLDTFRVPGLWREEHMEELVSRFGLVCVSRGGLHPDRAVHESDILSRHRHNIFLVREWIRNETSATEVRRALRRGLSVKYLMPDAVIDYIREHDLYTGESEQRNEDVALWPLRQQGAPPETLTD